MSEEEGMVIEESKILFCWHLEAGTLEPLSRWEAQEWSRRVKCCLGCAASHFPKWRRPVRYHPNKNRNAEIIAAHPQPCAKAVHSDPEPSP